MNWSDGSFYIIVISILGVAAIFSSIMTIAKGIKQLNQPILDLKKTIEDNEKNHHKVHMEHEKRISNLEGRMTISEEDREKVHKINRLTLKALHALLSNDNKEIEDANKEIKEFIINESV